jgi:TetR/AcrR family transcriptional regulator
MSTKSRRDKERENRRELILNAALSIMVEQGVHHLNIDYLAKHTELAKGTIYLYFKSKEEILAALTIRSRQLLYQEFLTVANKKIPPLDKIKGFVKANFHFARKYPVYYSLFSLYEVESQVSETDEMYDSSNNIVSLVAKVVEAAKAEGALRQDVHAEKFTMVLYGATVGVMQLIKVRGKVMTERMKITENQLINTFLSVLEQGIAV